jgi:fumarate reductase subunit C
MSEAVLQARRWYWQRISAMVLALCVVVHLGVIIYAVRGGLTGQEILARTRGEWGVALFYGIFVLAAAVHVPIGVARIAEEWAGLRSRATTWLIRALTVLLAVPGLRAVYALVWA